MSSRLKLAGICFAAAFALAACGGGGGGTTATMPDPTPPPPAGPTALETAVELDSRLDDVDVDQLQKDAIKYAGMLSSVSVKGDSAMAAANADKVLEADMMIRQAVMDADAVIEEANAAKMAAEDIEDATEKAAVMRLLDDAIAEANAVKTAAQGHIDEAASADDTVNTLGEAVAAVRGDDEDMPEGPADRAKDVAAAVRTALGTITAGAVGDAPMGAIRNDSAEIGAMTWAMIVGEDNVVSQRISAGNAITELTTVMAAAFAGMEVADTDVFATAPTNVPAAGTNAALGVELDQQASYSGIPGRVFCGGADCSQDADGKLTGSWYFRPDSPMELYVAGEDGTYSVATMYGRYGYWLVDSDSDGTVDGVATHAAAGHSTTNTSNLNLGQAGDPAADVTATYSGSAVGISVRGDASGEFTAAVNLTAKFAVAPTLRGRISSFQGGAVGNWTVVLNETALNGDATFASPGTTAGGGAAGEWTAQGYGPARQVVDGENVDSRPTGFFGRFNANFGDGAAAGAYTTRAD